jgi:hypothetical protein
LTAQAEMLRVFAPSGRVPAVLAADAEAGAGMRVQSRRSTNDYSPCPGDPLSAHGVVVTHDQYLTD